AHSRHVAPWSAQAGNKAELNRVGAHFEDNRNGRGRRLCCNRSRRAGRGNHAHIALDQVSDKGRQAFIVSLCPAIFDRYIAAFDETDFAYPGEKGGQWRVRPTGRGRIDEPDHRHRRLLRTRRERQCRGRAAEQRDELAPVHSITSSARASSVGGISRPSAFAVLRLITSSYLVGACTGRSAGFSPLRMRSTYWAARRYWSIISGP